MKNDIEFKVYHRLTDDSMRIRVNVFVDEQGFDDHPDEIDGISAHIVGYIGDTAVAVCRVFPKTEGNEYILGRFAVLKEYRLKGLGRKLLCEAEKYVKNVKGSVLLLHSQYHAKGFYEACGYTITGDIEYEQGEPHLWMEKSLV